MFLSSKHIASEMACVSIVMPSFNSEDSIKSAVISVLNQTYSNIELIVIDDCSNDATKEVLKQFVETDSRINLIELEKNSGGPAVPRNVGVSAAQGDYIAFIDSDDVWHPNKLEIQLMVMNGAGLNFLSSSHTVFSRTVKFDNIAVEDNFSIIEISHNKLLKKNTVVTSSVILTNSLAKSITFSEDPRVAAVEDYLAWLYLCQSAETSGGMLQCKLVAYRLRRESISRSKLMMARKIFFLLSIYRINGESLGYKRYLYFVIYVVKGLCVTMRNKLMST